MSNRPPRRWRDEPVKACMRERDLDDLEQLLRRFIAIHGTTDRIAEHAKVTHNHVTQTLRRVRRSAAK